MLTTGDKGPDSQEILRTLLEAHPQLREVLRSAVDEDATTIEYLLEYASTLSMAKKDCEAHFIAYIVVTTSRAQPSLAKKIVASVEATAASNPRLASSLRELFEPVIEGQPNVRTWQTCLRSLLVEGSIYGLGTEVFADRVRKAATRGTRHRFLIGLRCFLDNAGVPHSKARIILKRVGLLVLPLALSLQSSEARAEVPSDTALKMDHGKPHGGERTSILAGRGHKALLGVGIGVLGVFGIVSTAYYTSSSRQHSSPTKGTTATGDQSVSASAEKQDNSHSLESLGLPSICADRPSGFDRKECLIEAADASRGNFFLAERLYLSAIAEKYKMSGEGPRRIDQYWHGPFWSDEIPQYTLLRAQDANARVALASLYAGQGRFADGAATWWEFLGENDSAMGVGDCAHYIQVFLDRKAGIRRPPQHNYPKGGSYAGCLPLLMMELATMEAEDDKVGESLTSLTAVFLNMSTASTGQKPLKDGLYWPGIFPKLGDFRSRATDLRRAEIEHLKARRRAIDVGDTTIWLNPTDRLVAQRFLEPERFCASWNRPLGHTEPIEGFLSVEVGDRKVDGSPSVNGDSVFVDIPAQNKVEVAVRVLGKSSVEPSLKYECRDRRTRAVLCRAADDIFLLPEGQTCR